MSISVSNGESYQDEVNRYLLFRTYTDKISCNTEASYRRDLQLLGSYADGQGIGDIHEMDASFLNSFLRERKRLGCSDRTVCRFISSIRGFYRFLERDGTVPKGWCDDVGIGETAAVMPGSSSGLSSESPIGSSSEQPYLTASEMERLAAAAQGDDFSVLRDRAILELLCSAGLRVEELTALRIRDVDFMLQYLTVGAAGKEREIPFGKAAGIALRRYVKSARRAKDFYHSRNDLIFLNSRGGALSRQSIAKMTALYGEKAGIEKRVTPRLLRASCARRIYAAGATVGEAAYYLGIKTPASVGKYRALSEDPLKDRIRKAEEGE